jgi:hypothetical protein
MIQLNPIFSRNNFNNKLSKPKPFSCGIDNDFEKKLLNYSGMASPHPHQKDVRCARVLIKTLQKAGGLNKVTRRAGIATPPFLNAAELPLRGLTKKRGSTFILNLSGTHPERDTNMCFTSTNMEHFLGGLSIIKRKFNSKTPAFPPTKLGLDLTSTEKEKFNTKNDLLSLSLRWPGYASPRAKDKTLVCNRLPYTVIRSEFHSSIGNVALNSEIKTPSLPAKSLKEQTNRGSASPITDEWVAGGHSPPRPAPKKRGTLSLKTLYKRRSIYNYFETTGGLITSDLSLQSNRNIKGELSTNKTDSTEGSYKIASMNRRGRDKSWIFTKLWTNKFKKIKERVSRLAMPGPARASMLEESMLGDSNNNYNGFARKTKGGNIKGKSPTTSYKSPKEAQDLSKHTDGSTSTLNFLGWSNPYTLKKLFVSYLKQRKLNILNKHNGWVSPARERGTFLATSKVVSYSFSKISGATNSISIPTPNQTGHTPATTQSLNNEFSFPFTYLAAPSYPAKESATFKSLYKLLKSFFKSVKSLISYPILNVSPNKLIINLFYYVKPTRKKIKEHKKYQKYIRKEGKLFKENLLRSKFSKLKHRFNFILFLNKFERSGMASPAIISKSNKMRLALITDVPDTNSQYQINNQEAFIGPFSRYALFIKEAYLQKFPYFNSRTGGGGVAAARVSHSIDLESQSKNIIPITFNNTILRGDWLDLPCPTEAGEAKGAPLLLPETGNLSPQDEMKESNRALLEISQLEQDKAEITIPGARSEPGVASHSKKHIISDGSNLPELKIEESIYNKSNTGSSKGAETVSSEGEVCDPLPTDQIKEDKERVGGASRPGVASHSQKQNNLNIFVWEENFIRLRLIIHLFSHLKSGKEDAKLKESRFSSMCNFYLNHIKQLEATRALSEFTPIWREISTELKDHLEKGVAWLARPEGEEISGVATLKLENLEKLVNLLDTDLRPLNGKMLKDLIENKDKLILLKEQTRQGLNEILILLKELEFEYLNKKPIKNNRPNPYANKNINLLLINTLHELYRNTLRLYFEIFKDIIDRTDHKFTLYTRDENEPRKMRATPLNKPFKDLNFGGELVLTQPFKESRPGRAMPATPLILKVKTTPSATLMDNNQGENNSPLKGEGSLSSVVRKITPSGTGKDLPTIVSLNLYKFKFLIYFLEKLFNKPIELNLIRLKYPYHESNILAQVLALSSKKYKFFLIMRKLFYTASIKHPGKSNGFVPQVFGGGKTDMFKIIPSYLSGLKVRLAGRLLTEKLVPRKTVKTFQVGSLSRGKVNFKTTSRITLKNKRGAYSFTVTTSHILDNSTGPS